MVVEKRNWYSSEERKKRRKKSAAVDEMRGLPAVNHWRHQGDSVR